MNRSDLRKLKPGQTLSARGIVYERLVGDGRWWINIMVNGRRFHHVVGLESEGYTKTQAQEVIDSLRAQKHTRKHGVAPAKRSAITLANAAPEYLKYLSETGGKDVAKKTERLTLHLLPHLGGQLLGSMTETDLKRYSTKRTAEGASAATINRELAVVSHLFRVASDPSALGMIATIPCRIRRLREPEPKTTYLTPDQARALLRAAREDENAFALPFAMIGLHTGMRYSSILAIRRSEIDLEQRVIWVSKDKTGERAQPITGELAMFLARLPAEDSDWLFPSPKSRTGHAVNIRKAWHRVIREAKLQSVITPHTMRHTMASNAAHAGVDAATLQSMGGWKTRRMTERYTHPGQMREAMDKLSGAYAKRGRITPDLHGRKRKTA